MSKKFIPDEVKENYEYKETYVAGATKEIPLSYEINIFKHKTISGSYCATEIKTQLVEYAKGLCDEQSFRTWANQFHVLFSKCDWKVKTRMQQQGLDMWGNKLV